MLVDDPVKRVDNMTMAYGLEARVPFLDHELVELAAACPPELKLAHDGKGVLKEAARPVIPAEVIDRPKGYFPVPALSHLEGAGAWRWCRDALRSPAAKERGLFRPDAVEALLADPNGSLTPLRGNPLWQVALLELWLQRARPVSRATDQPRHPSERRRAPPTIDDLARTAWGDVPPPPPSTGTTPLVDCGWGRLVFGQTFADPTRIASVLRAEEPAGRRDICLYADDPTSWSARHPTSCSSTRRTPTGSTCTSTGTRRRRPTAWRPRPRAARTPSDADAVNQLYRRNGMVTAPAETIWANQRTQYLPPTSWPRTPPPARSSAPSWASTTSRPSTTPRAAPACGAWRSTRRPSRPGVGEALARTLIERFQALGRAMDGPVGDARQRPGHPPLREARASAACRCSASSARTRSTSRCSSPAPSTSVEDLNPYARIIADEALLRGIEVEVLDADGGELRLTSRRAQHRHPGVALRADHRGRHEPLRRQAGDPPGRRPTPGCAVPEGAWPPTDRRGPRRCLEEVGEVVVKPARGEQGDGITVGVDRARASSRPRSPSGPSVCPDVLIEQRCDGRRPAGRGHRRRGGRRRGPPTGRGRRRRRAHRRAS